MFPSQDVTRITPVACRLYVASLGEVDKGAVLKMLRDTRITLVGGGGRCVRTCGSGGLFVGWFGREAAQCWHVGSA